MKTGADMGNIYLTGMMGCGKSAIGKRLAERLELPFVDIDLLIEQQQKKTINEIFMQGGEALFRKIEANTLYDAAQSESGAVVSCGGGIVLTDENVRIMRETGTVVWIRRDINTIIATINTKKRPLLKDGADEVRRIFNERAPCYEQASDISIDNDAGLDDAVDKLITEIEAR